MDRNISMIQCVNLYIHASCIWLFSIKFYSWNFSTFTIFGWMNCSRLHHATEPDKFSMDENEITQTGRRYGAVRCGQMNRNHIVMFHFTLHNIHIVCMYITRVSGLLQLFTAHVIYANEIELNIWMGNFHTEWIILISSELGFIRKIFHSVASIVWCSNIVFLLK